VSFEVVGWGLIFCSRFSFQSTVSSNAPLASHPNPLFSAFCWARSPCVIQLAPFWVSSAGRRLIGLPQCFLLSTPNVCSFYFPFFFALRSGQKQRSPPFCACLRFHLAPDVSCLSPYFFLHVWAVGKPCVFLLVTLPSLRIGPLVPGAFTPFLRFS